MLSINEFLEGEDFSLDQNSNVPGIDDNNETLREKFSKGSIESQMKCGEGMCILKPEITHTNEPKLLQHQTLFKRNQHVPYFAAASALNEEDDNWMFFKNTQEVLNDPDKYNVDGGHIRDYISDKSNPNYDELESRQYDYENDLAKAVDQDQKFRQDHLPNAKTFLHIMRPIPSAYKN